MSRRPWPGLTMLGCAVGMACALAVHSATAPTADDKPAKKEAPAKDFFGLDKVHGFHLEIAAKEYDKMPPQGGGFPFGPDGPGGPGGPGGLPGRPGEPGKPAENAADAHKGGGFGLEFPWAHGEFTSEGKTFKNLGVRYKGNASYMASARGLKRNFKIVFDHYGEDQRFHGLKTLNLNAGAMDPTRAREALSYAVFRAAGVPAPRTAFAEVTLTVPGKYDKEYLGLYTVVEQVDKTFLKDRFKDGTGLLMKPERLRGIDFLGDDWERYKGQYQPRRDPSRKEAQRVIEFARLVNRADDEQFRKEIGSYLDVEEFLRFLAVNALLVNLDSFISLGHNYYLYLEPATNRFVFIPWDLDLSLASMGFGTPDQKMDLSLTHPHMGENKLIDRLLAIPDVNEKYQRLLMELAATCFTREQLLRDLDVIEKLAKELLAKEKKAAEARREGAGGFGFGPPGGGPFGGPPDLRTFVEKRTASVAAQVAGKSKGYVPVMAFGPGGPGGFAPPPPPGQVLPPFLQDVLKLSPEQRKELEALQKDVDARLGKILTEEQKKQLKDMQQGPRPGGFGPGGPGGPPGFGPPPGGRPEGPKKDDKKEEKKL